MNDEMLIPWNRIGQRAKDRAHVAELEARVAELTAQLTEARESERAAMTELNAHKDALAQTGGTFDPDEDAWPCPLGRSDCKNNCGSYGCGN